MSKRVHIYPALPDNDDPGDGGIRQVLRFQLRHLPAFGWEYDPNPSTADVIACHAQIPDTYLRLYPAKPFVVMNHGAYWTPDYDWAAAWCYQSNMHGLAAIRAADVTTAVSEWTANALRRNTARDIRVVHHGVDMAEWEPLAPAERAVRPYVLWNKTRVDPVCDVTPLNALAAAMPDVQFVSTFGDEQPNVIITGRRSFEEARRLVRAAGIYLCTTRETFGIGTLEAMAAGVPVVGYRWAGQTEIVRQGIDGILVTPGDVKALEVATRDVMKRRDEMGAAARERAATFTWEAAAEEYAAIFDEVLERATARAQSPAVSVIVPAYGLEQYLDATLQSVLDQTFTDWECIVVDDASPDRCGAIADEWAARDRRFRVIHNATNQYLAQSRNIGIDAARGRYIFPLDADDMIQPRTLATLADALDSDRTMDIAYGGVLFVDEDGATPTKYGPQFTPGHSGWPMEFDLEFFFTHPGQPLPYASMYRREVWERSGGYRQRARSSEDCDFWLRTTSYGFVPRMVTKSDTLVYRNRPGSMSRSEGWEEHRAWYPWVQDRSLLPAAAVRDVPAEAVAYPAHDPIVISVVIPVGPGHGKYVQDAVDSVDAQTFRNWECVVVNDSGEPLPPLPSWVTVIEAPEGRFGGVAAARNAGIAAGKGWLFLPLDADDMLQPTALALMFEAHVDSGECHSVVYSDWWDEIEPGKFKRFLTDDYDVKLLDGRKRRAHGEMREGAVFAVTALTTKHVWAMVGGYDPNLPAWEDWAFHISLAAKGVCMRRVPAPLFTYRKFTGQRRDQNAADFERSVAGMLEKDYGIDPGRGLMACSSCGGTRRTFGGSVQQMAAPEGAMLLEYVGPKQGSQTFRGTATGTLYRFSAVPSQSRRYVDNRDAPGLLARSDFQKAEPLSTGLREAQTMEPAIVASRTPGTSPALAPSAAAVAVAPASDQLASLFDHTPVAPPATDPPSAAAAPDAPATTSDPRVQAVLDQFPTRAALDQEAERLGISGRMANKAEVANAIVVMREMRGLK